MYIWNWFLELNRARGSNGFGPSPISFSDMVDWCKLTRREIEPWEVQCIRDIDDLYRLNMAEGTKD